MVKLTIAFFSFISLSSFLSVASGAYANDQPRDAKDACERLLLPEGIEVLDQAGSDEEIQLFVQVQAPHGTDLVAYFATFALEFEAFMGIPDGTTHESGFISGTKESFERFLASQHPQGTVVDFMTAATPDAVQNALSENADSSTAGLWP